MDFARKQLEKYGWSDGKGLGKNENGISEALKPKLKRSVAGIGHDPASEFNEHWWSALYDKAAKNVTVENKKGKTKKITTKDSEDFVISSSTWKINKKRSKHRDEAQYSEYFVRTEVLTNDKSGSKTENVKESDSEDEVEIKSDVFKMTDEELFAACEGRTAHKGARHGLGALGKLARIEKQEQMLLIQPQYKEYSHAKKLKKKMEDSIDQLTIEDQEKDFFKKKHKRKHCFRLTQKSSWPEKNKDEKVIAGIDDVNDNVVIKKSNKKRKHMKSLSADTQDEVKESKKKKKRRKDKDQLIDIIVPKHHSN